ncbi:hypothetical protein PITCH_A960004 [uncultured Desulfobacterium sp.]|uniref:Uncharacterized protein n=1 Tax=uncultured Desulfobacterium sp. TaxID=201089 RepID=A0A445N421_9BACT|nr:hypothetical protein PITCH_A960004 [uncultured Desulfobacterium sp.]
MIVFLLLVNLGYSIKIFPTFAVVRGSSMYIPNPILLMSLSGMVEIPRL